MVHGSCRCTAGYGVQFQVAIGDEVARVDRDPWPCLIWVVEADVF